MIKKLEIVAPPLSISHFLLCSIYDRIITDRSLSPKDYQLLTVILMYVQLRTKIKVTQRIEFVTSSLDVLVTRSLLDKSLYFLDAMASLDANGNIAVVLPIAYKQPVLKTLVCLLQDKEFSIKPSYENGRFYESTYISICEKLNLEKDLLFLWYLQNVHKKSKSVHVRGLSVINCQQSLEVHLYSKYDNFDKDECNNFRFVVTKSSIIEYPVGSYVFGVIQPSKCEVILYKDRECTLRI